jgi:branched-chain amino acid transport system substrate-binding protein
VTEPVKVGILLDFPTEKLREPLLNSYALGFEEALERGVIDRPVELIVREREGLPRGSVGPVLRQWKELAAEDCVAIIGPMISDNVLGVATYIGQEGHVPTITWAGAESQYNEWVFGMGNGSLSEEPRLVSEYLADQGLRRIAVVRERSTCGFEYLTFFQDACKREDLQIVFLETIGQTESDLGLTMKRIREVNADALVYWGFGVPAVSISSLLEAEGWDIPRVMATAFINSNLSPEWLRAYRGWIGVDQYDEANVHGQRFLDRYEAKFGTRPEHCVGQVAFDCARVVAEAIGLAELLTPEGVKAGLERVKVLPAAAGGPGTRISFGRWMRRGWHGVNYLVLRGANAEGTATSLVARFRE